jgi:chorismate--pyruvate lyase
MDELVETDDTRTAMWLPGHALNCYAGDAQLRSWLLTPGLLTQRFRDSCGAKFRVNRLPERLVGNERWREVEMCCGPAIWVFARTRFPLATLAAAPWLADIGDTPLGEAVAAHGGVARTDFEYSELGPHHDVVATALRNAGLAPQSLWARRSVFQLANNDFLLQEVFLPHVGRDA